MDSSIKNKFFNAIVTSNQVDINHFLDNHKESIGANNFFALELSSFYGNYDLAKVIINSDSFCADKYILTNPLK